MRLLSSVELNSVFGGQEQPAPPPSSNPPPSGGNQNGPQTDSERQHARRIAALERQLEIEACEDMFARNMGGIGAGIGIGLAAPTIVGTIVGAVGGYGVGSSVGGAIGEASCPAIVDAN